MIPEPQLKRGTGKGESTSPAELESDPEVSSIPETSLVEVVKVGNKTKTDKSYKFNVVIHKLSVSPGCTCSLSQRGTPPPTKGGGDEGFGLSENHQLARIS